MHHRSGRGWAQDQARKALEEAGSPSGPRSATRTSGSTTPAVVHRPGRSAGQRGARPSADVDRHLDEVGKPVDRDEWLMTPQTVNAYYHPAAERDRLPGRHPAAARSSPPTPTTRSTTAASARSSATRSATASTTRARSTTAAARCGTGGPRGPGGLRGLTGRLVAQYDALCPAEAPGQHVNGKLTLGENIGDLGGLTIAYKAYLISLARRGGAGPRRADRQRSASSPPGPRCWRQMIRTEEAVRRLAIDPHSPNEFRSNQIVQNLDAFHEAFGTGRSTTACGSSPRSGSGSGSRLEGAGLLAGHLIGSLALEAARHAAGLRQLFTAGEVLAHRERDAVVVAGDQHVGPGNVQFLGQGLGNMFEAGGVVQLGRWCRSVSPATGVANR